MSAADVVAVFSWPVLGGGSDRATTAGREQGAALWGTWGRTGDWGLEYGGSECR